MNGSIALSVAKNTSVMFVSQGITWISSFVLMLFLPRYLGSEEYGKLFLAISITTIFQIIVEFGGGYFIAKEVSRKREHLPMVLSNAIAFRFVLWLAIFVAMIWGAMLVGYSSQIISLLYILGFSKLWEGAGKVFHSACQGMEMMQYPSITAIIERVTSTTLCVTALVLGADVVLISVIMSASTLLNFFILSKMMNTIVPYLRKPQQSEIRRIVKASIPYFLWTMFSVAYYRIDAVMLSFMVPATVVGWYGAAYRFFDVLMFLPSIYSMALFPSLSKLWATEQNAVAVTTQKSLQFILLAGIPIAVIVFAFSPEIIGLFFGEAEYAPSILLLRIFSVGLVLVYIDFVLGTALFASDRQRQWTAIAFSALLLNLLLNYFLIPYTQIHQGNGGIGAAIATIMTEFFVMMMALQFLPRSIFFRSDLSFLFKGIFAGMLMGATLWLLNSTTVPWIVALGIGSIVYSVVLLNVNAIDEHELNFLRSFFSYKNLKNIFVLSKEPRI